ncbi:hypothetical protein IW261DRAFT_1574739 [Armillaria novae-zelandiae]|uniref:Uncharacterized protein n=1 Tax=Armillaria novae-zelandiae TaxID=153914 RepID=A0AA39NHN4_9AGAR|nr:hypothetical protein IW261DRAFT_1574739 [Armillaria novae-zelandiae]
MPSNTSSRSPSKRKLVHLSPVSVEVTPEPVPRKKNKTTSSHTQSSPKVSALMPAVSITYTRPRGRPALKRKVSYGELSAEEVESVIAPSDIDNADLSVSSLKRRGRVLFVDDEASEASQASEEPSADEDGNRTDCEPESDIDAVVQPSRSLSKVKTVKGSYVEDLLRLGNADDVAESDDVKSDPTLTSHLNIFVYSKGSVCGRSPSPVYLEDLESFTPKSRLKGKSSVKGSTGIGRRMPGKSKKEDLTNNTCLEVDISVDSTTSTLVKTMGLSSARTRGSRAANSANSDAIADACNSPMGSHTHADSVTPVQPKLSPTKPTAGTKSTVASPAVGCGAVKAGGLKSSSTKVAITSRSQTKAMVTPKKDVEPLFLPSDEDDVSTLAPAPASQVSSDLAALLGDDMHGSSPEPDDAHPILCLLDTTVAPHRPGPDLSEPDDPTLQVMQPELMEDHLVTLGVYGSLPLLGVYRAVVPTGFAPDTFDLPRFLSFSDTAKLFRLDSLLSLVEAFKFDHYGSFVNLAHASPSVLSLEGKSLHVSGSTAMCMTVGLVTECMLFELGHQGGYVSASGTQGGKHIKHLKIMPFHQMFHRESTTWALAFDLEVEDPSGHVLKLISTFIVDSSAHSSPAKGQWRSPAKKTLSTETVSPGSGYPTSMGFMDEVPIYDGHASAGTQFLFRPSDFAMIKSLPHFTTSRDLDVFTLVTVGYSLSVWTSFNNEPRVSPNILFAIVLGTAPKKEKLAELGFLD